MFSGASNVKIFGGNFRQINGAYNHYEYKTTVSNYNSNNVTGNTLTETYNDNSQEFHGVNAKGRAYVQAVRHASAPSQLDTSGNHHNESVNMSNILNKPFVPGDSSNPSSDASSTAAPVPSAQEAEPATVNTLAQSSSTAIFRVPHSKVSYMSRSVDPGDVSAMSSQAAAHFLAAFELMDQEDAAEDALPDTIQGSMQNPNPVNDNDNESTASRHINSLDNPSQLFTDEPSTYASTHEEIPETSQTRGSPFYTSIPTTEPVIPPHQFRSQILQPTSTYSHLAHSMRNVVTNAITRTHSDAHSMTTISLPTSQLHPPSVASYRTAQADEKEASSSVSMSMSDKSHQSDPSSASVSYSTPSASSAPTADLVPCAQAIFNGPYTEISHDNRTVNYPGSGNVSNNVIQTSYKTSGADGRTRNKSEAEAQDILSLKVDEPRGPRRRQRKYTRRRT